MENIGVAPEVFIPEIFQNSPLIPATSRPRIKVIGTLVEFAGNVATIEDEGKRLVVDVSVVDPNQLQLLQQDEIIQVCGELQRVSTGPRIVASWVRLMSGLDVGLYKDALAMRRKFQGQ